MKVDNFAVFLRTHTTPKNVTLYKLECHLGDVGIERGRPSIAVGSMLEVLARDCDVLDRLKSALLLP